MTTTTIQLPPITGYQRDAIFCAERGGVIEATTKAGKTFGCILWLLTMAGQAPKAGAEYWWTAPIFEQTKIAYRRVKRMLREADPEGANWSSNDTDLAITLPNQSVMRFKSADKPDGLYGEDVYGAVMDEASRCKEEAWHALRSTLTATEGKVRIIGNVKGRKNWAYMLARKVEAGNLPGWKYAKITAFDAVKAGVISQDEVEAARRELPEQVFRELYLAEPSEDGSNPFGLSHIALCVTGLSGGPPVVFGVDLAKSVDWTVVVGLNESRRPCVFERWQHVPWEETTNRIMTLTRGLPTLVDSTGVGDPIVETLQRRSGNVTGFKFTANSKQQLMEGLALAVQQHQVGILDGVMRQEMESFEYEHTRTGVRYTAPEGMHDDCVVALGLAVEQARTIVQPCMAIASVGAVVRRPEVVRSIQAEFAERRKDPNWGFE